MNLISFTRGVPPEECIPDKLLAICSQEVINEDGKNILQYGSSLGYLPLREFLADQKKSGVDQIVLGQGSLQLLDIIVRGSLGSLDEVAIEKPTYDRALNIFSRAGYKVHPVEMEQDGIDVDIFKKKLNGNKNINFIYVIPDFQNPTGSVMSLEKRKQLIELARKFNVLIIEDAPYRFLRYTGLNLPSIYDLAPDVTIYLSSFSKTICPGLRVGYAILPHSIRQKVEEFAEGTYINASFLNHAIVHKFIKNGLLDDHLSLIRNLYSSRLNALLDNLESKLNKKIRYVKPQGGFFVGLFLPDSTKEDLIQSKAEKIGLKLSKGSGFFVNGGENFLRLPFCAINEMEIEEGINRLSQIIN